MAYENTLLIRKSNQAGETGDVVSTLSEWNIACVSFPFRTGGETKEVYVNNWKDEHGEEAYIPDVIPMEAYDVEARFAYKGGINTAYSTLTSFKRYLNGQDGDGAILSIYNGYTGIGRRNCYMKSFADEEFVRSNIDDVLTFSVTFRVTDPVTDIILSLS